MPVRVVVELELVFYTARLFTEKIDMIQTNVGHLVFLIDPANASFYKDLLTFLGWNIIVDHPSMIGLTGQSGVSLWFLGGAKPVANDYDGLGLNHLALSVGVQGDVDVAADYLKHKGIAHLFETPRHRPDFVQQTDHTYYQVMFESPDRILFEIVYTGVKAE